MDQIKNVDNMFMNPYLNPGVLKESSKGMPSFMTDQDTITRQTKSPIEEYLDSLPDEEPSEFVSRKEWGAREPKKSGKKVAIPVKIVVFKYGTKSPPCESKEECIKVVQEIQRRHMDEMGMRDIGYNFLVSSDGTIYEGRGWTTRTRPYPVKDKRYRKLNKRSIDVVFIGDWTKEPPLADMMSAVADLCVEGEKKGYLHPNWVVFEPSRLKKPIIHGPKKVKSKKEEKANIPSFEEWLEQKKQKPK